jgi:uncharacterized protein YecT (DUF1311 family)
VNKYIKQNTWFAMTWLCLFALPTEAASFDCAKAVTKVEKLICADATLSKLDEELNSAYKSALQEEEQANAIKQGQKQWMKYRNNCKDADCVKRAYQRQLSVLTVTHIYGGESDVYTSASIDMRRPGYPFKVNEGKGVQVCEIYRKNLEALGNPNLACERKVSPEYQGIIKLPEWRKLDLWENRNLWAQVEKMGIGGINRPGWMESKDTPMDDQRTIDNLAERYHADIQRYNREVYKLNVANMDVDNDGKSELVLREHSGLCGELVHYTGIALFVLNEKGNMVDLQKSRPLFQDSGSNRWSKEVQQKGIFGIGSMYDIFFYKDKTYFDRWTWTGVWVYQISNGKTEAICQLN